MDVVPLWNITITAYDGYYSNCQVIGTGSDASTDTRTTNSVGEATFQLPGPTIMSEVPVQGAPCVDTFTNLPVPYAFRSVGSFVDDGSGGTEGELVLNTVTTLTAAIVDAGATLEDAMTQVRTALNIPSTVDITTYDAIAEAESAEGAAVYATMNQLSSIVVQGAAVLEGALATDSSTATATLFESLAQSVTAAAATTSTVALSDADLVADIILDAAEEVIGGGGGSVDTAALTETIAATAQATANLNSLIEQQVDAGVRGNALVVELSQAAIVSQTVMSEITEDLADGTIDADTYEESTTAEAITEEANAVADQVNQDAVDGVLDPDVDPVTPPPLWFPPAPSPWWVRYNPFSRKNDWAWGNNKATWLFVGLMVGGFLVIMLLVSWWARRRHSNQFVGPTAAKSAAAAAYEVPSDAEAGAAGAAEEGGEPPLVT